MTTTTAPTVSLPGHGYYDRTELDRYLHGIADLIAELEFIRDAVLNAHAQFEDQTGLDSSCDELGSTHRLLDRTNVELRRLHRARRAANEASAELT